MVIDATVGSANHKPIDSWTGLRGGHRYRNQVRNREGLQVLRRLFCLSDGRSKPISYQYIEEK